MKAGTALGLLAGLGAMNAMSGKAYGGKRFTGLLDMLDGGGAGQSGDKFEGGGLLSMLGNLFMKPLEAQQRVERIASNAAATNAVTEVLKDAAKKQFDSKTVQDLAAANEDAYLQEAYGIPKVTPEIAPSFSIDDRSGPVYTPPPSYRFTPMGEAGRDLANNPAEDLGLLSQVLGANAIEVPTADGLPQIPVEASGADMPVREGLLLPRDAEGILAPELPASERNTKLVSFNRRMETVPEMLRGSEIESMYRDYLLNGGLATFAQFANQSMVTDDPAVRRSPTPPALATPNAIVSPTVPITGFN